MRPDKTPPTKDRAWRASWVLVWIMLSACIVMDVWYVIARCDASPPVYVSGAVLGLISQALGVGIPWLVLRWFKAEPWRFYRRYVGIGALCFCLSMMVLQASILYSDGIGQDKSYRSVGVACGGPALRPGYGV